MRLIDADKFGEDLMKLWDYSCDEGVSAIAVLKKVIQNLDNAPTITPSLNLDNITKEDIKKFRLILQRGTSKGLRTFIKDDRARGEWKLDSVGPYCSECKKHPDYSSDFCPFCGADMRGENYDQKNNKKGF